MRNLLLFVVAAFACSIAGPAWSGCTPISATPYAISTPGAYCLVKNVSSSNDGITVNTDDVTLDCGGHTIDGSSQGPERTSRGIMGSARSRVLVRNCTVKGFMTGIQLSGTGNTVRDSVFIAPYSRGIVVEGEENVIDGNRVSDAGGAAKYSLGAFGILANGSSIIRGNVVSGVSPTTGSDKSGYGIYTSGNNAGLIEDNIVRNVLGDGGKIAMALSAYNSANAVLKENILINPPDSYAYALYCSGAGNVSTGNIFQGFVYGIASSCASPPPQ